MLDIKFIRENPELVKENIKKKFQDQKLPLVDEVIELDAQRRAAIVEADQLRSNVFESVLMRWMNLEPIIQNEVSQKEKEKYCILMHINRI